MSQLFIQAQRERNTSKLIELYVQASKKNISLDESCFLVTQAYILALESNHPLSNNLHKFLVSHNREK
ncbi:MAG: hypothetical protein CML37_02985 [Rhodobacteraceae bacterium]|nr:hypothetical protein [Paracoccaceae bacterium]